MRFLALAFAARACALTCNNGSRLALNMSSIDGVIEPALFGSNLEFTLHDIATGLSAQLVSNRFSVPFDARWPPRWEALRGGRDPAVDYPGASGRAARPRCAATLAAARRAASCRPSPARAGSRASATAALSSYSRRVAPTRGGSP